MTKDEVYKRGVQAERLLTDPLMQETFQVIEEQLLKEWRATAADDAQRREDAWRTLKLLDKLRSSFESYMRSAKVDKRIAELERGGRYNIAKLIEG